MPTSGTTFTDWEQLEADRRRPLFIDEDFSWSEPPPRRRRSSTLEPRRERRPRPAYDYSDEPAAHAYSNEAAYTPDTIDVERELDRGWGGRLSASVADTHEVVPYSYATDAQEVVPYSYAAGRHEVVPYSYAADSPAESSSRRTVVITGRGAPGTYSVSRRQAEAGLAFHERSSFNPDRMAMWAVLLGIALLLGCIAH